MYVTYRSFKLPANVEKQASCVTYNGRILHCQDQLRFDTFTTFKVSTRDFQPGAPNSAKFWGVAEVTKIDATT